MSAYVDLITPRSWILGILCQEGRLKWRGAWLSDLNDKTGSNIVGVRDTVNCRGMDYEERLVACSSRTILLAASEQRPHQEFEDNQGVMKRPTTR